MLCLFAASAALVPRAVFLARRADGHDSLRSPAILQRSKHYMDASADVVAKKASSDLYDPLSQMASTIGVTDNYATNDAIDTTFDIDTTFETDTMFDFDTMDAIDTSSGDQPLSRLSQMAIDGIRSEADATFDTIDTDGNGLISADELRTYLTSIGYTEAMAKKLFEILQYDKADPELSRNELRSAFAAYSCNPSRQATLRAQLDATRVHADADALFEALDGNGDGEISVGELRSHVASIGYKPAAAERFFELLDADQDGAVSRGELRLAFERYEDPALRLALGLGTSEADAIFATIDANADGAIEESELRAYLERKGYSMSAAASIFATLDVDADGQVSQSELREGYVRYAALREALGLGRRRGVGKGAKKQPIRWGRGGRKGA